MQPCLPFPHQVLVSLLVLQDSCLAALPPLLLLIVSPGSHFARLCSPSEHVRLCGCLIYLWGFGHTLSILYPRGTLQILSRRSVKEESD